MTKIPESLRKDLAAKTKESLNKNGRKNTTLDGIDLSAFKIPIEEVAGGYIEYDIEQGATMDFEEGRVICSYEGRPHSILNVAFYFIPKNPIDDLGSKLFGQNRGAKPIVKYIV